MSATNNVKTIAISDNTKSLLSIRAEISECYAHLVNVLQDIDPKEIWSGSKEIKDALLEADRALMKGIAELMDEEMLVSDFAHL